MKKENEIKDLISQLYEDLRANGLCKNKFHFSRYYLNRSPRYFSALQSGNDTNSIQPLQNAAVRIKLVSELISKSNNKHLSSRLGALDDLSKNLNRRINAYTEKQLRSYQL